MKIFFPSYLISGILGLAFFAYAPIAVSSVKEQKPIIVAVIEENSKTDFEVKSLPILNGQMKNCSFCEIKNFSPYDKEGNFDSKGLEAAIASVQGSSGFLYLGWNRPVTEDYRKLIASLKGLAMSGVLIVGSAGTAGLDLPTTPLNRTVLGQIPDLIIIGELKERETLVQQSYYGPEMLTAIQPPKEFMNQGKVTLFFVAKLAQNWNKRPSSFEWLSHLKITKAKSRKLWPSIEDFFRR